MEATMRLFYEVFEELPRQGPGDNNSTRRAYNMLAPALQQPRILDIGCGRGMQTIALAQASKGSVVALDNYRPFLDKLAEASVSLGLSANIEIVEGSMFDLPLRGRTFDLIWSEGAIYIIGLEKGLKEWQRFLRPGGYLAVTELSWLKSPPQEAYEFWLKEYPAMQSLEDNVALIESLNYRLIGHFTLPETSWWRDFYTPLVERLGLLRRLHKDNITAQEIYDSLEREIDLYRRYSDTYGYVFYVMQRAE